MCDGGLGVLGGWPPSFWEGFMARERQRQATDGKKKCLWTTFQKGACWDAKRASGNIYKWFCVCGGVRRPLQIMQFGKVWNHLWFPNDQWSELGISADGDLERFRISKSFQILTGSHSSILTAYLSLRQPIVIPLATAHSQNTFQVCYLTT